VRLSRNPFRSCIEIPSGRRVLLSSKFQIPGEVVQFPEFVRSNASPDRYNRFNRAYRCMRQISNGPASRERHLTRLTHGASQREVVGRCAGL
jgi:hypothetical protein